jgi:hypothetical protein
LDVRLHGRQRRTVLSSLARADNGLSRNTAQQSGVFRGMAAYVSRKVRGKLHSTLQIELAIGRAQDHYRQLAVCRLRVVRDSQRINGFATDDDGVNVRKLLDWPERDVFVGRKMLNGLTGRPKVQCLQNRGRRGVDMS